MPGPDLDSWRYSKMSPAFLTLTFNMLDRKYTYVRTSEIILRAKQQQGDREGDRGGHFGCCGWGGDTRRNIWGRNKGQQVEMSWVL